MFSNELVSIVMEPIKRLTWTNISFFIYIKPLKQFYKIIEVTIQISTWI